MIIKRKRIWELAHKDARADCSCETCVIRTRKACNAAASIAALAKEYVTLRVIKIVGRGFISRRAPKPILCIDTERNAAGDKPPPYMDFV